MISRKITGADIRIDPFDFNHQSLKYPFLFFHKSCYNKNHQLIQIPYPWQFNPLTIQPSKHFNY